MNEEPIQQQEPIAEPFSDPIVAESQVIESLDYRDLLRETLDKYHAKHGTSNYRMCNSIGIDQATLTNILKKRRHVSLEKLDRILGYMGLELAFARKSRKK